MVSWLGTNGHDFGDFDELEFDFIDFEIWGCLRWGGYAPPDPPLLWY